MRPLEKETFEIALETGSSLPVIGIAAVGSRSSSTRYSVPWGGYHSRQCKRNRLEEPTMFFMHRDMMISNGAC